MLLAPIETHGKLRQISHAAYNIAKHRFDYFTTFAHITDSNDLVMQMPKFLVNLICTCFYQEQLRASKKTLCVTGLLFLNIKSTDMLEDIVPLISGTYLLVYINCNVKWHQLLRLIRPHTEAVLIRGKIEIKSNEVQHFVNGLLRITRYIRFIQIYHMEFDISMHRSIKEGFQKSKTHRATATNQSIHISLKSQKEFINSKIMHFRQRMIGDLE